MSGRDLMTHLLQQCSAHRSSVRALGRLQTLQAGPTCQQNKGLTPKRCKDIGAPAGNCPLDRQPAHQLASFCPVNRLPSTDCGSMTCSQSNTENPMLQHSLAKHLVQSHAEHPHCVKQVQRGAAYASKAPLQPCPLARMARKPHPQHKKAPHTDAACREVMRS